MNFSWLKNSLITGGIFLPVFAFAQVEVDTSLMQVKHIDAVHIPIVINPMPLYPVSGLTKDDIEVLNTDDVAGLAAKVPGATVRSYGGMGGLKTVSMRGLGGQHTAVIIDGFQVTNAQAGQMNLGQLQSEGLESADAGLQVHFRKLIPVSANFTGSYLQFGTFMGSHYGGKLKVKSAVRYGSFMRKEAYVQGERAIGNWSVAGFGKYRGAEGAYPFQYVNGSTQTDGIRGNNDYQDMHVGVKLSRIVNGDGNMRVIYRSSFMDQGLPGAVIFYNETADERMKTQDHRLMLDFTKNEYQSNYRLYFNAGANNMDYFDPTHLNATGYLHNTFLNLSMNGGYIHFKVYENVDLKWGGEQKVEALTGNRTTLGVPLRTSSYGLFGAKKMWGRLQAEGLAGVQLVVDNNGESQKTHVQFTPNAKLQYDLSENKPVRLEFLYKRNFRLPSFNELYFGEVGNSDLQPEIAHQFNLGYHWRLVQNYYKWQVDMNAQTFYNRVRNKIVAIPTKNLFIWSMQNVQEAQIYGAIGETRVVRHFGEDTRVELLANYTWQRVIDITQDAITYGHQVAYAPEHTANADIMFIRRGFSARISNNFVSGRYALNQNVPANYLDPFWTLDAAVGYKYTIKNKHKIGVQFNVRNLTNVSYAFIRSYVMPGRHYLLTLNYEIL